MYLLSQKVKTINSFRNEVDTQTKRVETNSPFDGHTENNIVNRILPLELPKDVKSSAVDANIPEKDCDADYLACGWAVYVPFTKIVSYYMKNTCYCAPNKSCIRLEDNTSSNAFVYKCISVD